KIVDILKSEGLDGIEVEYSSYSEKDTEYYKNLALEKNLLMVGGSDFHGENRVGIDIAHTSISKEDIKGLLKRREMEEKR
ncbi:MAG: hypothetical protein ACRCYT_05530, partial [Cetobacterium sp.]